MHLQLFTSLKDEWNDSLTGDFLWTKTNLGEAIAETMTPLSWSVAQFTFSDLAYLPGLPTLGNICGFPYFNITGLATALHVLGFSRKSTLDRMEDLLNILLYICIVIADRFTAAAATVCLRCRHEIYFCASLHNSTLQLENFKKGNSSTQF